MFNIVKKFDKISIPFWNPFCNTLYKICEWIEYFTNNFTDFKITFKKKFCNFFVTFNQSSAISLWKVLKDMILFQVRWTCPSCKLLKCLSLYIYRMSVSLSKCKSLEIYGQNIHVLSSSIHSFLEFVMLSTKYCHWPTFWVCCFLLYSILKYTGIFVI